MAAKGDNGSAGRASFLMIDLSGFRALKGKLGGGTEKLEANAAQTAHAPPHSGRCCRGEGGSARAAWRKRSN